MSDENLNDNANESDPTLEDLFVKNTEQKNEIENLRKKLKERDDLIKRHFNTHAVGDDDTGAEHEDDEGAFSAEDVKKVVELVKKKRS